MGSAGRQPESAVPPRAETASAISVVVCSHARPHYLEACLKGLGRQTVASFETIVVDSASPAPEAAAIASAAARSGAKLLRSDQPGLSLARNRGLEVASGRWVAYLDDDAVPDPDWAERLAARISSLAPNVAALGGRILPDWEAPLPDWWPTSLRNVLTIVEWEGNGDLEGCLAPGVAVYGANMAFSAAPLRAIGGFPVSLGRIGNRLLSGEEVEVLDRLYERGLRAYYDGAVTVRHSIQKERLQPN